MRVNFLTADAEQSENLNVFSFNELLMIRRSIREASRQILYYLLGDEVVDEEFIVLEKLLEQIELAIDLWSNYVVQNELKPFGDMHFEEIVFADQLSVNFVKSVVKFKEFFFLIMLVWKDIFFQVHLHKIKQLKQQLTYAEIFTNHLAFSLREN